MGTFTHAIRLFSPAGAPEDFDAPVDTGATFSVFPSTALERLGVLSFDTLTVQLADGREEQWKMGEVDAQIDGQRRPILCLFGASDAPPLLGAHALEAFLLTVDPVDRKLVPKPAYLMPHP